jgi:2-amino-1-hydroxyethylphosphonate dioxygenase (glycine-forming)
MQSPQETATFLIDLLNTKGQGDYIGEPISQLEHSLQAAHLAKKNNADDETVLAALLHDVGQFLPGEDVRSIAHEVQDMADDGPESSVGRVGHVCTTSCFHHISS